MPRSHASEQATRDSELASAGKEPTTFIGRRVRCGYETGRFLGLQGSKMYVVMDGSGFVFAFDLDRHIVTFIDGEYAEQQET